MNGRVLHNLRTGRLRELDRQERKRLIEDLRGLGGGQSADSYFDHSGGKVSLTQAREFYDRAVRLAAEAAALLDREN